MHRSFQQRRLLEGQSTQNIYYADALKAKSTSQKEMDEMLARRPDPKSAVRKISGRILEGRILELTIGFGKV
jgi:hypothetical protein